MILEVGKSVKKGTPTDWMELKIIKWFVMREYWKEYFKGLDGNHRDILKRGTEINECINVQEKKMVNLQTYLWLEIY